MTDETERQTPYYPAFPELGLLKIETPFSVEYVELLKQFLGIDQGGEAPFAFETGSFDELLKAGVVRYATGKCFDTQIGEFCAGMSRLHDAYLALIERFNATHNNLDEDSALYKETDEFLAEIGQKLPRRAIEARQVATNVRNQISPEDAHEVANRFRADVLKHLQSQLKVLKSRQKRLAEEEARVHAEAGE